MSGFTIGSGWFAGQMLHPKKTMVLLPSSHSSARMKIMDGRLLLAIEECRCAVPDVMSCKTLIYSQNVMPLWREPTE